MNERLRGWLLVVGLIGLGVVSCESSSDREGGQLVAVGVPGTEMGPAMSETPESIPTADPIKAYQGTVVFLGPCGVGIVRVASDYVDIDTVGLASPPTSQRWLREGQVLVACGSLHRVVGLVFERGANDGGGGRAVLLDPRAVTAVGTTRLTPGSVVLTVDGTVRGFGPKLATLRELSISNRRGRDLGRFRILAGADDYAATGGPGDDFMIGDARYQILDVVPTDDDLGLPGWVEIAGTPTR